MAFSKVKTFIKQLFSRRRTYIYDDVRHQTIPVFRRATEEAWLRVNPILINGEVGVATDTGQMKIGNGINHWADLHYYDFSNSDSYNNYISNLISPQPVINAKYTQPKSPTICSIIEHTTDGCWSGRK